MTVCNRNFWSKRRLPVGLLVAIFVVCLAGFGFTFIPMPITVSTVALQPDRIAAYTRVETLVTLLSGRELTVRWPEKVWAAERFDITLHVSGDREPNPSKFGGLVNGNAVAVARLEMDGGEAFIGERRQPLLPGQEVNFQWQVHPTRRGPLNGKVWLHLEWIPKGEGEIETILLLARPVSIHPVSFLGIQSGVVRIVAGLGILLVIYLAVINLQEKKSPNDPRVLD